MHRVCVFCGASAGNDPAYAALARSVGEGLARRGIGIVYGGGRVGLMGVVADAALAAGGEVIGVIPRSLVDRELAHPDATEMRIVGTDAGTYVELQGTAEGKPFDRASANELFDLADSGLARLFEAQTAVLSTVRR